MWHHHRHFSSHFQFKKFKKMKTICQVKILNNSFQIYIMWLEGTHLYTYFACLGVCWLVCLCPERLNGWTDLAHILCENYYDSRECLLMLNYYDSRECLWMLRISKSCLHILLIFVTFWKSTKKCFKICKLIFFFVSKPKVSQAEFCL